MTVNLEPVAAPLLKHETDEERLLRDEADNLEVRLHELQAELALTESEWNEFRARYIEAVGGAYAELEEVERQIAEFEPVRDEVADEEPEDEEAAEAITEGSSEGAAARGLKQVRKLFWRVAKMLHPDLASDDAERDRRHELMTEASQAYRDGDMDRLSSLLDDESDTAVIAPERDELAALRSRVALLKRELHRVETDIKHFAESPFFGVKTRCDDAARRGRDLLSEMRAHVADQVIDARRRLDVLRTAAGASIVPARAEEQAEQQTGA